ncbi:threonine synthase [Hanseniaspora osmophila]|uniref:Threonine synthase n=1 Tax=Hanseniaspora osmophila TaxID=56408 RepID=A0A1E5REK6_9ASCO|nr:Threonine synthase [Hanseniaspora osmophila]
MSQTYRSSRSASPETVSFETAIIQGLGKDGGLFIPSAIPQVSQETMFSQWSKLSFQDLAFEIMKLYVNESEIPHADLKDLINKSYSTFRSEEVTPLNKNLIEGDNINILELFHGPTYAFKDVALQFVGNLFEYFLNRGNGDLPKEQRKKITVVGATSGDTGSAAIYGLRGKKDISVFILYPTGRISPIQEEQMTTVPDKNVQTLSVKGTFDNCQDIVKAIFADKEFNENHNVGAVNSINWARILAQITYYFYSYFKISGSNPDIKIKFVVPSGNFGDILAGYFAKKMGLPVQKLVIATNENDILDRFLKSGDYARSGDVKATLSPAMDILISSNFERLLWYLARDQLANGDDIKAGEILSKWFSDLKSQGKFSVGPEVIKAALVDFDSERVSDPEILETIKQTYETSTSPKNYILDPHTAVGVKAVYNQKAKDSNSKDIQYISLSTAHPAKFASAVDAALRNYSAYSFEKDVLPADLKKLSALPKKIKLIERADIELIKATIDEELSKMDL